MKSVEFAKMAMETSKHLVMLLIDDMKDAPLTQPTVNGGNHPLWVLGHLAYSEANIVEAVMLGETNPLDEWKDVFGGGSEAVADANHYPPMDEVLSKFEQVRERTMTLLAGFTEDDLDKPSKACPPERQELLGTIGRCLMVVALHPAMHFGQVADARRAAGRKPVFA